MKRDVSHIIDIKRARGRRAYRNSNGDADEEHIRAKVDVQDALIFGKLVVHPPRKSTTQTEWKSKAGKCDRSCNAPIADKEANVGL